MFLRLLVLLAVFVSLAGCGREGSPKNVIRVERSEISSAASREQDVTAILSELTQAVRKYSAEQRTVPKSLDELVSAGYLKQLPAAPAGKNFVIEPRELKVGVK
jgi:hypothetical protein